MRDPIFDKTAFSISVEDSRQRLPEHLVDQVIQILKKHSIDGGSRFEGLDAKLIKEELWDRLIFQISRLGEPSPTNTGTTPKQLLEYTKKSEKILKSALSALQELTYEHIYEVGSLHKEYIVSMRLRQSSLPTDKPRISVSEGHALLEKQRTGQWPELNPFDHKILTAIQALENIIPPFTKAATEMKQDVSGRGIKKKAKDNSDQLIYQLCCLYKYYTGKAPRSNDTGTSINSRKVTGGIIELLQTVLPLTSIQQKLTGIALHKRVKRLSKNKEFSHLWQDSKK